jgi:hypothetical protein
MGMSTACEDRYLARTGHLRSDGDVGLVVKRARVRVLGGLQRREGRRRARGTPYILGRKI